MSRSGEFGLSVVTGVSSPSAIGGSVTLAA
jgi:hypothetical protein